jgi:diacylglycerol O-acyltransferase / wax synthase
VRQLSGLDASFLNLESSSSPLHVSSLVVLDGASAPDGFGYQDVVDLVGSRIRGIAPFREKLVEVPLGLDHPYWMVDPDFDLEFHVRHSAVPSPGSQHQLAEVVARLHARPLDRSRPLWEMYVIEGLEGGDVALFTKMHHAAIDGVSGAELAAVLLDLTPEPDPDRSFGPPLAADREPGQVAMLARGARGLVRAPRRLTRTAVRTVRMLPGLSGLAEMALPDPVRRRVGSGDGGMIGGPSLQAPPTPFNAPISPHRRIAYGSLSLERVKAIKKAQGTTVNDVVMAVCAGALRRYLLDHDALPDRPLQAMVPISVRSTDEAGAMGNRVTAMVGLVPTHLDDPLARLQSVSEKMAVAKDHDAVPADLLSDITQFAPPAVATRAARAAARLRWADRLRLPFNLVISNVPGPPIPLYVAGARVRHIFPISAIIDGLGCNITVMSHEDVMDIGVTADRELVPDPWTLVDLMLQEEALLAESSGV